MSFFFFLNLIVIFLLSVFIPTGMLLFSFLISFKDFFSSKVSSYECGFDIMKKVHSGFSLVFFSIVLMFIIFELEVIIFIILIQSDYYSLLTFFFFYLYVVISFYMEWYFGKLVWLF